MYSLLKQSLLNYGNYSRQNENCYKIYVLYIFSTVVSVAFSIVVLLCCYQGRFRLRKKKPEQEEAKVTNSQADQSGSNDKESKPGKEQEEDLPDLKDPEVHKATSLIQVLSYSSTNIESKVTCLKTSVKETRG